MTFFYITVLVIAVSTGNPAFLQHKQGWNNKEMCLNYVSLPETQDHIEQSLYHHYGKDQIEKIVGITCMSKEEVAASNAELKKYLEEIDT